MKDRLREKLRQQVVLFDGAMGSELYKRGFFVNTSFEGLNLSAADVIREIHQSYVDAGADVLTTNSFAANRNILNKFGLGDRMEQINREAVRLAREAGGPEVLLAASVGPVGDVPYDRDLLEDDKVRLLTEQIAALAAAGADFILFETTPSVEDVTRAIQAICAVGKDLPYMISFAVDAAGESAKGEALEQLLAPIAAAERKPTALGLNCGGGAECTLSALEKLAPLVDYPLIVQPNAGVPKAVDGRTMYMTSPEYLTTYAMRYVNLGARGIGGCCGTGPDHIRDMARSVRPLAAAEYSRRILIREPEDAAARQDPLPTAKKSRMGCKLANGEWLTSIELVPPRGYDLAEVVAKSAQCRDAGVDAINIPDGPRASSRISPIVTAQRILEGAGIEPVLHFCCRDKNLIGMQADLLGCAALGIHNILFITGDPPKLGDYPFATGVFDADSIGMVQLQSRLNCGLDVGGKAISPPTETLIGVGADPNAIDMKRELRRTREKVAAGAEFLVTQPVFDAGSLLRFLDAIEDLGIPVMAGIWPLASYRNAEFMRNEVPGVVVPDDVMERMAKADGKDAQRAEGIAFARETVAAVRHAVAGIQVSAPFGNVNTAIAVIAG